MSDRQNTTDGMTFRAWIARLEELVALAPDDLPEEGHRQAMILLHDLIGIGLRNGAMRAVVSHSSGPVGFAHRSYRYPFDEAFDWSGQLALANPTWQAVQIEARIAAIERAADLDDGGGALDKEEWSTS